MSAGSIICPSYLIKVKCLSLPPTLVLSFLKYGLDIDNRFRQFRGGGDPCRAFCSAEDPSEYGERTETLKSKHSSEEVA